MKIAFDGHLFLKGDKTGIAWNAHNLILELAKYPENECTIQCFRSAVKEKPDAYKMLREYRKAGCKIERCQWFSHSVYKLFWVIFPVPYSLFFRTKPDIMQFFNFTVPPGVKGKRVVFIHDMAYKSCTNTVNQKTRYWLEISMKKSCRHADHIITVSEFSKKEIIRYLPVSQDRVSVVPNAVDHCVYHAGYRKEEVQKVLHKYGIEQEYFLYLGTIEPRKNLERLIGAYAKLCRQKKHVPQLVLAGKKGWLCKSIYEKAHKMNLGKKILFTGYVEQENSPLLMCGAKAFVFPSIYEGFGMPPLEAMACKTPVITSNTTALAEVVKDAGITVDPMSEEAICGAMCTILEDEAGRERLRDLGYQRAAEYTWAKSAEKLMDVYRMLCG